MAWFTVQSHCCYPVSCLIFFGGGGELESFLLLFHSLSHTYTHTHVLVYSSISLLLLGLGEAGWKLTLSHTQTHTYVVVNKLPIQGGLMYSTISVLLLVLLGLGELVWKFPLSLTLSHTTPTPHIFVTTLPI